VSRLLLDTHLLLWWLGDDPRLPRSVLEMAQAAEAEVFVSQASLWELAIKLSLGRLAVDLPLLERQVPAQGFRWLPIRHAHLLAVASLDGDGEHRDPFDRLLVCQSQVEPMLLLTADRQLQRYGATVVLVDEPPRAWRLPVKSRRNRADAWLPDCTMPITPRDTTCATPASPRSGSRRAVRKAFKREKPPSSSACSTVAAAP
jgi:PIN domain nuclease of toxin-antitoxin system